MTLERTHASAVGQTSGQKAKEMQPHAKYKRQGLGLGHLEKLGVTIPTRVTNPN